MNIPPALIKTFSANTLWRLHYFFHQTNITLQVFKFSNVYKTRHPCLPLIVNSQIEFGQFCPLPSKQFQILQFSSKSKAMPTHLISSYEFKPLIVAILNAVLVTGIPGITHYWIVFITMGKANGVRWGYRYSIINISTVSHTKSNLILKHTCFWMYFSSPPAFPRVNVEWSK